MGSSLSGNYGGRPTVEGCQSLVLPVSAVVGRQNSNPVQGWRGSISRTNSYDGAVIEVRFRSMVNLTEMVGFVDLEHAGRNDAGVLQCYRIHLQASRQPFGGLRWWFACPIRGDRACKLYLPNGAARFASREAFRLAYRSTRETPKDRAYSRAWKRRLAMGGRSGIPLGAPLAKPPRRHWSTWERDEAKLAAAEAACDRFLILSAMRIGAMRERLAR